jgi:FtsH-binding integral membrane protein
MQDNRLIVNSQASVVSAFMTKVYGWMTFALLITGGVAWFVSNTPSIYIPLFSNSFAPIILMVLTVGLVMVISGAINKLSVSAAVGLFTLYSVLMGVTLSAVFLIYTRSSIASTFFISAAMFGVMSIFGMLTKHNLSGMGRFMMMGLIGIIIASIVNIFLKSEPLYWVITYIGVLVFAGLTAYDTQRLKETAYQLQGADASMVTKVSITGALSLYLDFINLFLMLLRILGDRR